MRWTSAIAATLGWLFSWTQLRGIGNEYLAAGLGPVPLWLLIALGLASTLLLATAIAAMMDAPFWPKLSVAVGLLFITAIYASHWALLSDTVRRSEASIDEEVASGIATDSLQAMLRVTPAGRPRSAVAVAVFIAGVPTALVLGGLTLILRPTHRFREASLG